jgi:predicted ATP-grasp superfamily ATP-dependent carboligase
MHQLADDLGIGHPATYYPRDHVEVAALECQFPVILKPAFKEGFNAFVHAKAWQVDNRNELLLRYEQARAMVPSDIIMVQELIPGDGRAQFSYAALCTEGQPRISLVARRTRQYPADFGRSSTFVETVDEPDVEQASIPLLAALHYTGLMEVEFKRDARNGQLKLLDMNPRVWGWHTLSRRFGGDFPYLYWQLLHNQDVPTVRVPSGVRWIRAVTDTMAVLSELWHGQMTLMDYVRSLKRPLEHAILAPDDPLPALLEALLLAEIALRRKAL